MKKKQARQRARRRKARRQGGRFLLSDRWQMFAPVGGIAPSAGPWPILVVGPGRCGSSTTARLLHTRMGVCMGARFQKPDESNPKGYYEDKDFQWANAMLLGGHQDTPQMAEEFRSDPRRFAHNWRGHVEDVIRLRQAMGVPWGVKDPLLCHIMETYARLLPECRIIRCQRPVAKVAASFQRIYGWPIEMATGVVLKREDELDEMLGPIDRPILGLSFAEQRTDDELVDTISAWLERTQEHVGTHQEQRRQGPDGPGPQGHDARRPDARPRDGALQERRAG